MLCELKRHRHRLLRRERPDAAGREGFSLVEILVVMVILAIGVIPIAVVQHRAGREVTEADLHTQAITLVQGQLERIKGMGFGVAAADSGLDGNIAWQAEVINVSFGLDRVQVTATWNTSNTVETITMADLVSMR